MKWCNIINMFCTDMDAEEWLKIEKMLHGDCGFHIEVIMEWLSQPHETTADEDLAEIGFAIRTKGTTYLSYGDVENRIVEIFDDDLIFHTDSYGFYDKTIDQIRTIADKKRVEMGWK